MIIETGSDLLPVVPKERKLALREIVYKIFDVINGHNNNNNENIKINKIFTKIKEEKINDDPSSLLVRSYTDINDQNYIPSTVTDLRPVSNNIILLK